MDHQHEHHQHHQKEREHEKKMEKLRDEQEMKQLRVIHPAWFVALGVIGIGLVILVWTML